MRKISGISELIDAWGGNEAFGKFLWPRTKQPKARACMVRARGYVPSHHWPKLVDGAASRKILLDFPQLERWRKRAPRTTTSEATRHDNAAGAHTRQH